MKKHEPMTPAERKRAERERKRTEGFVLAQVWVRPRDLARLRKYVERLNQG